MKLQAFSVYDAKAEAFAQPFFEQTTGSAIRAFSDVVNEDGHAFNRHADDYTLYHIGAFNGELGRFEEQDPLSLGNALQYKETPA